MKAVLRKKLATN